MSELIPDRIRWDRTCMQIIARLLCVKMKILICFKELNCLLKIAPDQKSSLAMLDLQSSGHRIANMTLMSHQTPFIWRSKKLNGWHTDKQTSRLTDLARISDYANFFSSRLQQVRVSIKSNYGLTFCIIQWKWRWIARYSSHCLSSCLNATKKCDRILIASCLFCLITTSRNEFSSPTRRRYHRAGSHALLATHQAKAKPRRNELSISGANFPFQEPTDFHQSSAINSSSSCGHPLSVSSSSKVAKQTRYLFSAVLYGGFYDCKICCLLAPQLLRCCNNHHSLPLTTAQPRKRLRCVHHCC